MRGEQWHCALCTLPDRQPKGSFIIIGNVKKSVHSQNKIRRNVSCIFCLFQMGWAKKLLTSFSRGRVIDFPFPRNRCDFRWAESCKKIRHLRRRYLIRFLLTSGVLQGDLFVIALNSRIFLHSRNILAKTVTASKQRCIGKVSRCEVNWKLSAFFKHDPIYRVSSCTFMWENTVWAWTQIYVFRGFFSPRKIFSFRRRRLEKMMIEPYQKLNVWLVLDREDDA